MVDYIVSVADFGTVDGRIWKRRGLGPGSNLLLLMEWEGWKDLYEYYVVSYDIAPATALSADT